MILVQQNILLIQTLCLRLHIYYSWLVILIVLLLCLLVLLNINSLNGHLINSLILLNLVIYLVLIYILCRFERLKSILHMCFILFILQISYLSLLV